MRINRVEIQNFDGFKFCQFDLNPQFNLLIGDNAAGKSSAADALSIAIGSWFLGVRGHSKPLGIKAGEVRVTGRLYGDKYFFEKQFPSRITASGLVMEKELTWTRELSREGGRTKSVGARSLEELGAEAERKVREGEDVTLPLICTYGTERLWYESTHRPGKNRENLSHRLPSRLDGYRDCNNFMIQESELIQWVRAEVSLTQQRESETAALKVFKRAITGCVDAATNLYYDERMKDIVVLFGKKRSSALPELERWPTHNPYTRRRLVTACSYIKPADGCRGA